MDTGNKPTLDASLAGDPGSTYPGGFPVAHWTRYEFLSVLGHGGMGSVYRARDRQLGRDVALKFILGGDPDLTLRLLREARAQARVDHPNICKVYEAGEVGDRAYIAMELIAGRSLRDAAADMSLHDKVLAVRDAAFALHEAHKLGILHRDIKPANIMIECDDAGRRRPIVMDFGIAHDQAAEHHTQTGALLGTPAYMSPEQARGRRDLDRRADVYSLGATLYELLAGVPPFRAATPMQVVLQVLNEDPTPLRAHAPTAPDDLVTIASKCLDKDPSRRYDSARALAEDLDRWIRGEPILGRALSWFGRLRRRAHKHRALVAVTSVALVAVLAAAVYGITTRIAAAEQAAARDAEAAALAAESQLGRELVQTAESIDWLMRTAHTLPLHDTRPERAMVRDRMDQVAARVVPPGISAALVAYTLGRGHLALGDVAAAHDHLARALADGLDTPELHYALGLALGERYEEEAAAAKLDRRGAQLARRLAELERLYLQPALESLERARAADLEAPSYLAGRIALYRGDQDAAIAHARRARDEAPWLYEAHELEAQALLARADARQLAQDTGGARAARESADQTIAAALEIARSDARVHDKSLDTALWLMMSELGPGFSPQSHLPHIVELSRRAAVARPDLTTPFDRLAEAYFNVGAFHMNHGGGDPQEYFTAVMTTTDRALAIDPDDFAARSWRLAVRATLLSLADLNGVNADADLAEVNRDADLLLAQYPEHERALLLFSMARHARILRTMQGGDPSADIQQLLDVAWAADRRTDDAKHAEQALDAYGLLATWLVSRGRDPGPPTARAEEALARCLELNPGSPNCPYKYLQILLWYAEYALLSGADPRPGLALVRERGTADTMLEAKIRLYELEVDTAVRRGEDPGPPLAEYRAEVERCKQHRPDWFCTLIDKYHAVTAARAARGRDDERAALVRAREVLGTEDAWDIKMGLAEVGLRLATLARTPADRDRHLAEGLAAAARGLELHPDHPRLLALSAGLHLLTAQTRPTDRGESLRLARVAMARARELNPWMHVEFADTVVALERTAG